MFAHLRLLLPVFPRVSVVPLDRGYCCSFGKVHKNQWKIRHANHFSTTMSSEEAKRFKNDLPEGRLKIGTHNGIFHCDELLACFMLQQLPQYATAQIVRSRDSKILDGCDIVVDVGGTFDRARHRYDHHQGSFNETLNSLRPELNSPWNIRLSSAGLVYTYFGEEVLREVVKRKLGLALDADCLRAVYRKVYDGMICEVDAIDNGVPMFEGGEPQYNISSHLSARAGKFNPVWNEPEPPPEDMERFEQAKAYVGQEFEDKVLYYVKSWWPARDIVRRALVNRFSIHESGAILELEKFCPWKEHLYELEKEHDAVGQAKYVIYFNKENDWRIICVPNQSASFVCRKFLAKPWRGVRDSELVTVSGIEGATFCHQTGFIGGNLTREGALRMAVASLEASEE
ncbi:MYG1 exonuclease-like [Anopheles albimanus]|uniref:MYG1 exonuclease-like n=1 Tax=Anopheles albimanus TaxID=7167 RepID=UPI001641F4DA|nr:MYG1 exonuclease-like [Anopheles albimanus]